MKRMMVITFSFLLVVVSTGTQGRSQATRQAGSGCPVNPVGFCETETLETIRGQVLKISRVTTGQGTGAGIYWLVKTSTGTMDVHLGPAWYLGAQKFTVQLGDRVEIKGLQTNRNGKPVLLASEIRRGNQVLMLRDARGIPLWRR